MWKPEKHVGLIGKVTFAVACCVKGSNDGKIILRNVADKANTGRVETGKVMHFAICLNPNGFAKFADGKSREYIISSNNGWELCATCLLAQFCQIEEWDVSYEE